MKIRAVRATMVALMTMLMLMAAAIAPASGAPRYSDAGVSASVSGNRVTATAQVSTTAGDHTVSRLNMCVRDARDRNRDMTPNRNVVITTSGTTYERSQTFANGTYTYWSCVQRNGQWFDVSAKQTFTVPGTSQPGPSTPPTSPAPVTPPPPTSPDPVTPPPPAPPAPVTPPPPSAKTDGRADMAGYAIPFHVLTRMTDARLREVMALTKDGGAGWFRFDLPPTELRFPGGAMAAPTWAPVDRIVNAADAAGLQILAAPSSLPQQVQTHGWRTGPTTDTQRAAYVEFVRRAAERYGPVVDAWELWNEPNYTEFWAPAPSASDYVALIRQAYPAIKAADPDSPVIAGGTAWVGGGRDIPTAQWYREVYAAGGHRFFDATAVHPYPDIGWSRGGQHFRGGEMGPVTEVRATMNAHGDRDKAIWGTEVGYPTGGSGSVTEREQGDWLPIVYAGWADQATARGATGPLFWYTLLDSGGSDREGYFGAIRPDGSLKPSYVALRDWSSAR